MTRGEALKKAEELLAEADRSYNYEGKRALAAVAAVYIQLAAALPPLGPPLGPTAVPATTPRSPTHRGEELRYE